MVAKGATPHESPDVRYEKHDVHPPSIAKFAVGLTALTLITCALMVVTFRFFDRYETSRQPAPPLLGVEPGQQPPLPRLQERPFEDIRKLRAEETRTLSEYGWVDASKGIVRIPVDRAIEILAQRGLPARGATEGEAK